MEQFYDIERTMADSDSKCKIITGDFNTKIGTKTKEDFKSKGAFGIGEGIERGDCLIEFTEEHKLIIANTLFQKPKTNKQTKKTNKQKNRYWTWESPHGETRNQIDFTLNSQRGIVTNCEVITKADIGSDQRLVRMTLRINKRLARLKTVKSKNLLILTHKNSKGTNEILEINLKDRFEKLDEEVTTSNFSEIVKRKSK